MRKVGAVDGKTDPAGATALSPTTLGPVLAVSTRGEIVEAQHSGHVVLAASDGVVSTIGDSEIMTPMRSTAKAFFVARLLEVAGRSLDLRDDEIALMCSSHNGEPYHVRIVESLLQRYGLSVDSLRLGTHPPVTPEAFLDPVPVSGLLQARLQNNCSGKHAGLALFARHLNQTVESYYESDGAVTRNIAAYLRSLLRDDERVAESVDGCGVVNFSTPLRAIADLYMQLASGSSQALSRVRDSMLAAPYAMGGIHRLTTSLLSQGVLAKEGFGGLYVLSCLIDGRRVVVAVKLDSSTDVMAQTIAFQIVDRLTASAFHDVPNVKPQIYNQFHEQVGEIRLVDANAVRLPNEPQGRHGSVPAR